MPSIAWQRVLPVIFSILVIIAIGILRNYSKTIAAITATMPINVPLAIWILSTGTDVSQADTVKFIETLLVGLIPTVIFLVVAYFAARAGWTVAPIIISGYIGWAITLAILLFIQSQLGQRL